LYGNLDIAETLDFIDRDYLADFDRREIDSKIKKQDAFAGVKESSFNYSITEGESLKDNTYLSYNVVVDTSLNRELYIAFQIIEYALLESSGAVLKEALLSEGIGKDILSTYENGIYQPFFSIIAKNANEGDKEKFLNVINRVLTDITQNGFDKKALLAGINSYEFRYREADFGNYPKGLMYGLQAFDSWLYDGDPIMHIAENDTFELLKQKVNEGYFEDLVKKYLMDNKHASVVIGKPVVSLNASVDAELAAKLDEYKKSLSEDEIADLVNKTKHLKKYQEEEDPEEVLAKLPLLSIDDLGKKSAEYINRLIETDGTQILAHDIFTNGIAYIRLIFNLHTVPTEDLQYVSLLKELLRMLSTENYSYADLESEINLNSGGISVGSSLYGDACDLKRNPAYKYCFEIKASVLYDKMQFAFDMFREILFKTDFSDNKRLKELMFMLKSRMQAALMNSGHSFASLRAMSNVSELGALSETMAGITYYRFVESIVDDFDNQVENLKNKLKSCLNMILTKENFILADIVAKEQVSDEFVALVKKFESSLGDNKAVPCKRVFKQSLINEGFKTSGKVQYVAKGGNYFDENHKYTGRLKILRVILGYDYLWNNVRVMGGAYGCFSSFTRYGDGFFVSYRDPKLTQTLDIYDRAYKYLEEFEADERTMTKYIIGTIADLDTPLTPYSKGNRSMSAYLSNLTYEMQQKERDDILSTTAADIRSLAGYLKNLMDSSFICVLGGEEVIKEASDVFGHTEALFKQ